MKSILVATDGSDIANKAVLTAAEMAKAAGAKLTIINVQDSRPLGDMERFAEIEYGDRLAHAGPAVPPDISGAYARLAPKEAATVFDQQNAIVHQAISDAILLKAGQDVRSSQATDAETISTIGDAAQEIVTAARSIKADLIVIGSHGLGGLSGLLGSVSRKVLHHAPANVLTVF